MVALQNDRLVAFKNISGVNFAGHVIQSRVVAVGDDGVGLGFEGGEVVDYAGAEEGDAVFKGGLVHYDAGAFGLDAFHYALDGALAEVVGAGLHGEAEDADHHFPLLGGVVGAVGAVVACLGEDLVGYVVLAGAVAVNNRLDEVLGDVVEVGEQLLGVLGEAVAAVAEGRVVIVRADAGVEADAFDDGLGIEALHLGVGVQFVEVADAQGEVGVGEELDGLGLGAAHEEHGDVFLEGSALDEFRKGAGGLLQRGLIVPDDDAAGVQVVVQGLALAEELRGEDDARDDHLEAAVGEALAVGELLPHVGGVPDGHGGLDDHDGVRVDLQHQFNDLLHVGGVEEVLLGVVVGGGGDDDEVGAGVCGPAVEGGGKPEGLLRKVLFDVFVLDGTFAAVDLFYFLGDDVDGDHLVLLREERGDGEADVSGSCYCDFHC